MKATKTRISDCNLRDIAAGHQHDNQAEGDAGYCEAEAATWSLKTVDAARCVGFESPAAALEWLSEEIRMSNEDGLERGWEALLVEEIREPVVLLERGEMLYVWDGWHRMAAARARGISLQAIVGVPI
jgi:hypothetical protein